MPDVINTAGQRALESVPNLAEDSLHRIASLYLMKIRTEELAQDGPPGCEPQVPANEPEHDADELDGIPSNMLAEATFHGTYTTDLFQHKMLPHYHQALVLPGLSQLKESLSDNPRVDMLEGDKQVLWYVLGGLSHSGFEVEIREFVETSPDSEHLGCLMYRLTPRYLEDGPSVDGAIQPQPDILSALFGSSPKQTAPLKLLTLKQEATALASAALVIDAVNEEIADALIKSSEDTPVLVEFQLTDRTDDLGPDALQLSEQDYITLEIILAHLLKGASRSKGLSSQGARDKSDSDIVLDRCGVRLLPGAIITYSRERPAYQIRAIFEPITDSES